MTDKKKDIEELIAESGAVGFELPDELKNKLMAQLGEHIGATLAFDKILVEGAKYSLGYIQVIEPGDDARAELKGIIERTATVLGASNVPFADLAAAKRIIGLKLTDEVEEPLQAIVHSKDGRICFHALIKEADKEMSEKILRHLIITGLESHQMIRRVLHEGNFIMPEGVAVEAIGPGVKVTMGTDGHYTVKVETPSNVEAFAGPVPEELKEQIPEAEFDFNAEGHDDECDCAICQTVTSVKERVGSLSEKDESKTIH